MLPVRFTFRFVALCCLGVALAACVPERKPSSPPPARTAPSSAAQALAEKPAAVLPSAPATPPAALASGKVTRPAPAHATIAPATAAGRNLVAAQWADVPGWQQDKVHAAWPAFRRSCEKLARQAVWQRACKAARVLGDAPDGRTVRQFFEQHFQPWQVRDNGGATSGVVTGYYEPLLAASRTRSATYHWPLHGRPRDLVQVELADAQPEIRAYRLRGRMVQDARARKKVIPYWSRKQIRLMGARFPAPVVLWAKDPVDAFFLQIQGSGRAQLPDGSRVRVAYADHNGHPYRSIGRWLVQQGYMPLSSASMQGIKGWLQKNPGRLHELFDINPAYVFFKLLPDSALGPKGALGVPLTPGRSIAVDKKYITLGAPVFLSTTYPLRADQPLQRLVMAQDTGGAIQGAVRADLFWGFGGDAGQQAGRMNQRGQMWLLWPAGALPSSGEG